MRHRPINLNLFRFHFPLPAIISILHRLSGLLLIAFIPCLLWILQRSLASELAFEKLKQDLNHPGFQFVFWVLLSSFGYHLLAGIRHILIDLQLGDSLKAGRLSAKLTFGLAIIFALLGGLWIGWK